jgi:hypothetical protein
VKERKEQRKALVEGTLAMLRRNIFGGVGNIFKCDAWNLFAR